MARLPAVLQHPQCQIVILGSLAAGYDTHLVKPTSLDTLRDVIVAGLRRQGSGIRFAKGATRGEPVQPAAAVPPLTKGNANR